MRLNGVRKEKMKRPPNGSTFDIQQMRRVDFLDAALHRLQDDVGTILNLVDAHNNQASMNSQRIIGFWACLRMILPIVEAIAHVQGLRPETILRNELNIPTPYLAWHLFRHSLTHGDYLQHGTYQGKVVSWGVMFVGAGHVIQSGHIGIDIPTLYQDLETYLQREIARNDQAIVDIEVGINYQTPSTQVIADFALL
jgi:hypothetical protein